MNNGTPYTHWEFVPRNKSLLFVLSGPSGVGKDAVLDRMKESSFPLTYIVTMTTRPRRESETDGTDYTFVSEKEFHDLIDGGGLLEWANVYGNWYGVPRREVETALNGGSDVMVKVDIQGVDTIRRIIPDSISIFLVPPSLEELSKRLTQRKTESATSFELRLKTASEEMKRAKDFDYVVVNRWGEIEQALSNIQAIVTAEKCRVRNVLP